MDGNGVLEVAARFEKLAHATPGNTRDDDASEMTSLKDLCGKLVEAGLQDIGVDSDFPIPRLEDYSSSDESDCDDYQAYYTGHALSSIASAIQHDFIRAIPSAPKSPLAKGPGSAFDQLSGNSSIFASENRSAEEYRKTGAFNMRRKSTSSAVSNEETHPQHFCSPTKGDTLPLIRKPGREEKSVLKQHAALSNTDLPRNALVNFLGSVEMSSDELRLLSLERSLLTLQGCEGRFGLLRILGDGFSLQDCNEVGAEALPVQQKNRKKKKKSGYNETEDNDDRKTKGVPNILSCMKCVGPSRYQVLQHNNSINLKGYEVMKRKRKMIVFDYRRIIYCGADIDGASPNLLTWLYHTVTGSYSSVQCYAVVCDDPQHARNLARAIGQQMAVLR
ncbi:not4 protein [Ciona intestinalis]